ncbi:hypothetical protein CRENBAI_000852 [Crenichthys baileyi]|uniref:Uncharacterized protein n=1 Tax=Crenichthys baileyi TaxID=28760 RepID=A0AAV9RLD6_9TELE
MDHPTTTMPKGKTPAQQAEGCHSARSKEATPPFRDADPPTSRTHQETSSKRQNPPQYEAQKPDASAEPSDARPAAPRPEVRAATHRTTAPTPQHTIQRRTECSKEHPEQKLHTKLTLRKCTPTSPPKTKSPVKAHPHEKKIRSIQVPEHARHPYPCQKQPCKEAHPEAHKRQESPQSQNQNPSGSQDRSTPRPTPARPLT